MPEIDQIDEPSDPVDPEPGGPPDEVAARLSGGDPDVEILEGLAEADERDDSPSDRPRLELAEVLEAIESLNNRLGRRFDTLENTFAREHRAEATRERVVDRLHAELQEYKQDFLLKVQRPIFIDLIQLHDDIGKMAEAREPADDQSEGSASASMRGVLESIQVAIEDILYRQGVEPFAVDGLEFDPRRQRAVSAEPTGEPSLNKRVASRLRKGFCSGDKLIRPEIVTVYTFRPST